MPHTSSNVMTTVVQGNLLPFSTGLDQFPVSSALTMSLLVTW